MAIRGDDDINALLNEFGADSAARVGDLEPSEDTEKCQAGDDHGFCEGGAYQTFISAFTLCPPSNPLVESIRHRCHEKFKTNAYDAIRSCSPNDNTNEQAPTTNAQKNQFLRSVISPVWNDMPPHNIWERYQFSLKQLEAECVREMQKSSREEPPWCKVSMEQMLNPSVQQIYSWILHGRSAGILWEPLIPVSSICDGSDDSQQINQNYSRTSLGLLEKEMQFQFRRSFKQYVGGGTKQSKKQPLSLEKVYSRIKSFSDDHPPSIADQSDQTTKKKSKDSKKQSKKLKEENTSKSDMEEFVLQHLFESQPFHKCTQKLKKKLQYLSDDSYSSFIKQLKKCSQDQSQQQLAGHKRKKGGKRKHGGNIPKISFADNDSSSQNDNYERQATVSFGGIHLKINESHLLKLKTLFHKTLSSILPESADFVEYENYFAQSLFTLLLRYDALEGAGLQSAIPPQVFRFLRSRYGCDSECFASPFNCWVESKNKDKSDWNSDTFVGGNYGSAFGDTDSFFGSAGTFFDTDFRAMAKKEGGGCFQANPPFASNFMEVMCSKMHHFLGHQTSDDDDTDANEIPIMFIIFVPAWKESHGWKALEASPFLTKHMLLLQKEDEHYYAEGTQHRRRTNGPADGKSKEKSDNHGSHRIASFDTSVFFLQNNAANLKWEVSGDDERKLKLAFAMKLDEVGDAKNNETNPYQAKPRQSQGQKGKAKDTSATIPNKPSKKNSSSKKGPAKKKSKLLEGRKDEMGILASLGLVESSSSTKSESGTPSDHPHSKRRKRAKNKHVK